MHALWMDITHFSLKKKACYIGLFDHLLNFYSFMHSLTEQRLAEFLPCAMCQGMPGDVDINTKHSSSRTLCP